MFNVLFCFGFFCTYNKTLLSALVQEFPFNSLRLSASFNSDLYPEGALIRINDLYRVCHLMQTLTAFIFWNNFLCLCLALRLTSL